MGSETNLADREFRRFSLLCDRYVADILTEPEAVELDRLLEDDPSLADTVWEQLFLDIDLKATLSSDDRLRRFSSAPGKSGSMDDLAIQAAFQADIMESRDAKKDRKRKKAEADSRFFPASLLIALIVLIFGSLSLFYEFRLFPVPFQSDSGDEALAFHAIGVVSACADAEFPEESPSFQTDQRITTETVTLLDGMIEFQLENGVRLVLEGPGELRFQSTMHTFCRQGRLSVFVPPQAKGFEATTPLMSVRDLGTEFVLEVDEEKTELHVVKGQVESNWLTKDWIVFSEGSGVRVTAEGKLRRIPGESSLFMAVKKVAERVSRYTRQRSVAYDAALEQFRGDPDRRVLLDFTEEGDAFSQVRAERRDYGSLPNRKSITFRSRDQYVELESAEPTESLTLWASVRLDRLGRNNTLLLSERFYRDSGILWQVDRHGALQFHQRVGEKTLTYDTSPIIGPEKQGVWIQLALVVHAPTRTVTHYVDGRPVATFPYKPEPIEIGRAGLGNELPGQRKATRRYWSGLIDAFVVLGRPLEENELNLFD